MTTRQKRRDRNCTRSKTGTVTQKRAFTSCSSISSNSSNSRKRKCKVGTTLREDCSISWSDLPVVVAPEYYDDDILENELFRYSPKPPKWDESPRSSMHIVDLTNTSPVTSPPKLPVIAVQRKAVQFTTHPHQVHFVDYSYTASSTWYNRTEYASFKSDLKETILALYRVKGQLSQLDMNQYTFSGLERSLTHRQITERKNIHQKYIQMIKQLYQTQPLDNNDPTLLRHVSMIYTTSSMWRAHLRGMIDHDFLYYSATTPE